MEGTMGKRKSNLGIALVLLSVVLAFFIGIMIKTALFGQ
ncbi:cytochrome oxidase small assembly protein [Nitrogeniibacter mangrovi]|nr:cytochrome oxidase small assembly protein [Nitrogeniibacter mangrovi]